MKNLIIYCSLLFVSFNSFGQITWFWMDANTQQQKGTFVTNGNLVNGVAPAGNYTISDFTVTNTTTSLPLTGSFVSGEWANPQAGFIWDGTIPTEFWRSGGQYTNGFGIFRNNPSPNISDYILFAVNLFSISNYLNDTTEVNQPNTILLSVVQTPTITLTGNTTVEGTLNADGFQGDLIGNVTGTVSGSYTKEETYTKTEVDGLLANANIVDIGSILNKTTQQSTKLEVGELPVFENNFSAISGGLKLGAFYRTSSGVLMVVFTPN